MKRIAFDFDGVLIDYEKFIEENGPRYFKLFYGIDNIINLKGFSLVEKFELNKYYKNKGYSETEALRKAKKAELLFWMIHMPKYCFATPLRPGTVEAISAVQEKGYQVYVPTGRMLANEKNILGWLMRKIVKHQLKKNGINNVFYIFCAENDDKKEITYRNYFDILVEDKPKNVLANNEITDTICVNANYSLDYDLGRAIRVNGFLNEEFLDAVKKIEERNSETLLPNNFKISGVPSEDRLWRKYYNIGDTKWTTFRHSPYERMQMATKDFPEGTFLKYGLIFSRKKMKNKEFNREVDICAESFRKLGINEGDAVPFQFANTPEAKIMIYALYKIKAKIVPIFGLAETNEIIDKLRGTNIKSKIYLTTDICYSKIKDAINELGIPLVVCLSPSRSLPKLEKVIFPVIKRVVLKAEKVPYGERYISYEDFKKIGKNEKTEFDTSYSNSYTAAQLYTGGTVKFKGVEITEGNIDAGVANFLSNRFDFQRDDFIADFMPLDHTFGLFIANHIAISLGVTLDVILKLNINQIDKILKRVNIFGTVPTLFNAITRNPKVKKLILNQLKAVLSGGAPLKQVVRAETDDVLKNQNSPARVADGFGLTETTGGVIYNGIPVIGHDIKIVDPLTKEEKGYGKENTGLLCIKGPLVFKKYTDEAENTVFKDGWFITSDTGYIDENGLFCFMDRADDLIIVNGNNVYPKDIEDMLDLLPEIKASSVVGRKDERKGQVPVALIELDEGFIYSENLSMRIQNLYQRLPHYARPINTLVVDKITNTRIFKPDKRDHRLTLERKDG